MKSANIFVLLSHISLLLMLLMENTLTAPLSVGFLAGNKPEKRNETLKQENSTKFDSEDLEVKGFSFLLNRKSRLSTSGRQEDLTKVKRRTFDFHDLEKNVGTQESAFRKNYQHWLQKQKYR